MNPAIVLHMTAVKNSVQASARISRFIANELNLPIVDDLASLRKHVSSKYSPTAKKRKLDVFFVNSPSAFSDIADNVGEELFPCVNRVFFIQNDYTMAIPPHQGHSRPTNAVTPYRKNFFYIPEFHLWSTCHDILAKRDGKGDHQYDSYINWNALTYAPFKSTRTKDRRDKLLYYGALRKDRKAAFAKYLNTKGVTVSASSRMSKIHAEWNELAPLVNVINAPQLEAPKKALNGNHYALSPILTLLDSYKHSIYMSDKKSLGGDHSLANRFYEVLSCPDTVLWLEHSGAAGYERAKLEGFEDFLVKGAKSVANRLTMPEDERREMAEFQRETWNKKDPYQRLVRNLHKLVEASQP